MQVNSVAEILVQLEEIIDWSRAHRSRNGYFAALYRQMSIRVVRGIEDSVFEDGPRMERITVAFANRYFDAWDRHQAGQPVTRSWQRAFDAATRWWPIVTQHLLLGVNAHINLDLGIAVAASVPRETLDAARSDFDRINELLARLIDETQRKLAQIWRCYRFFDWATGRTDEQLIYFSLRKARNHAWDAAKRLAVCSDEERPAAEEELDRNVERLGRQIIRPGLAVGAALAAVRLAERASVDEVLSIL